MLSESQLKKLHGKEYVESFEKNQSKFRLERLINSLELKPSYDVVDFACGNAMMLPLISNKVSTYTGVDFSEEFIRAAENNKQMLGISNAEFACEDVSKFCSTHRDAFDVAFTMDFSEHVYDDEWIEILKAIRSSLKSGGVLYLHTPNADFFLEKMKAKNILVKQFPEHIAVRSPTENCDLLMKAGFKIRTIELIEHYNILRFLHLFSFIPFIGKWFKARIFIEAIA